MTTFPTPTRIASERGTALLTVLLLLSLSVAMLGGFMTMVVTDQKLRAGDQDSTRAFYGAHGALEKLTADLGNLFLSDFAPSSEQIEELTEEAPEFDRMSFEQDGANGSGYRINVADLDGDGDSFDANGSPEVEVDDIPSGPFVGLRALSSTYILTAVARASDGPAGGSEVHLERKVNTVSIPLFQFGMFSEPDLSIFAGPSFDFGGRVHTNGNLFLASGDGPLTMRDRVTIVGEAIRSHLSNGWDTNTNYNGQVRIIRSNNVFRNLAKTEGSLLNTLGSAQNEPTWTNISIGTYNGYIRNSRTGARRLDLPFVSFGATPVDLIKRGISGEDSRILDQRYYKLASLRILLSDTNADLTALPGVNLATPPLTLDAGAAYGIGVPLPVASSAGNVAAAPTNTTLAVPCAPAPVTITVGATAAFPGSGRIRIATNAGATTWSGTLTYSGKTATTFTGVRGVPTGCGTAFANNRQVQHLAEYATPPGTSLIGGVIKIEMQRADFTWTDVTLEILNLGIAGRNLTTAACAAAADPSVDAVIRLQRLRPNPIAGAAVNPQCGNGSANPIDYVPNVLYDTREGLLRDIDPGGTNLRLGGVMHYVELDVRNLSRWFNGQIGASGNQALNVNGFTVYFSDRRTNRNQFGSETGEFGYEDFVNPLDPNGVGNTTLDQGEDADGDGTLDRYGETAIAVAGSTGNWTAAAGPRTPVSANEARLNRAVLFRRALKLVNGDLGNIVMPGLTIASENPVYVQGNYNANGAASFGNGNAAAAVMADAVTLLSRNWNDETSLANPHNPGGRNATTTGYRMAILSGKGRSFPRPGGTPQDFGTDGGAHNFLRYLENWGDDTLYYRGAIASFFYNRQAVGTYKCCTTVYNPPTRVYSFDTSFRTPSLLPPQTPMFRDVNTTAFRQVVRRGD
jgi:hypothetical protein